MASKEPAWLAFARQQIGVREIVGPKHSPVIMGWVQKLGAKVLGIKVVDDETAWCGTFVAMCMMTAGLASPAIAVRASGGSCMGQKTPFGSPGGVNRKTIRPGHP